MSIDAYLDRFVAWATTRDDVAGVLLIGSQARVDVPADEWSDVDLVLVVDDPDRYLADADWLASFGNPLLTLVETTPVGGMREWRVLYEDGLDVDISLFSSAALQHAAQDPTGARVVNRGCRVLLDRAGLTDVVTRAAGSATPPRASRDVDELQALGAAFWYHAVWAARKLARGELMMAARSVNGELKERLLALASWHARAGDAGLDTWHDARFFERWADPRAIEAMRRSYAHYDPESISQALLAMTDAFGIFERETAARLGLPDPPARAPVRALMVAALTSATGTVPRSGGAPRGS